MYQQPYRRNHDQQELQERRNLEYHMLCEEVQHVHHHPKLLINQNQKFLNFLLHLKGDFQAKRNKRTRIEIE